MGYDSFALCYALCSVVQMKYFLYLCYMEKLVYEYLNSIVGDNPTLSVLKLKTHFNGYRGYMFQNIYSVNGIKVGSRKDGVKKISMKSELYHSVRVLFGLSHTDTSQYFNDWLNNIPKDGK